MKVFILAALAACGGGGSNSTQDGALGGHCLANGTCDPGLSCSNNVCVAEGIDAAIHADAPHADAAPVDSAVDSALVDGSADAPGGPVLTVKNYFAWCSVIVDGHPASSAATQTVPVTAGTIAVSAVALTGFQLGTAPWHDTAGDTGAGDPGTRSGTGQATSSATTVVVSASGKCAWVCCEFTGGGGCPTADQCP